MNITKSALLLVAGMASLTVACSTDGVATTASSASASSPQTSTQTSTSSAAPSTTRVISAQPVNSSTTTVPASDNGAEATGEIIVHVSDLDNGTRLGGVEVRALLVPACDPSHYEMPAVDGFLQELRNRTDNNGNAVFSAPLGCWSVVAMVPSGYSRVDSSRAAVYLVNDGDRAEADLQLKRGLIDPCDGEPLANAMGADTISVNYCDGSWAQVHEVCGPSESCEMGPGDNARILRLDGDHWVTYTGLPSTLCLSQAKNDGVPAQLHTNFNPNC